MKKITVKKYIPIIYKITDFIFCRNIYIYIKLPWELEIDILKPQETL